MSRSRSRGRTGSWRTPDSPRSELHVFGDNFGGAPLNIILAGVCSGLETSFDVCFLTFAKVLPGNLGQSPPENNVVKFRPFLFLTIFTLPGAIGSNTERGDALARGSCAQLRIAGEPSNENHLVNIHSIEVNDYVLRAAKLFVTETLSFRAEPLHY